jgi:hypothetical protein
MLQPAELRAQIATQNVLIENEWKYKRFRKS